MTTVDLSPILTPLLQVVGIAAATALTAFGSWALTKFGKKLGIQANAAAMQSLDDIAMKGIQAAVMVTQAQIVAKGWDHPDVQNQLVAAGANYVATKFKDTLAQSGIDPSTTEGAAAIKDLVTRALPAGVAVAAASPTTPPVPDDQKPTVQATLVPAAAVKELAS